MTSKFFKRIISAATAFAAALSIAVSYMNPGDTTQKASAENISPPSSDSSHRPYLEYCIDNGFRENYTSGVLRQTKIFVYAKKGETICLGSDVFDSLLDVNDVPQSSASGADIVLITPHKTAVTVDVIRNGLGYIRTRSKETAGPNFAGSGNTAGYTPYEYEVEDDGVYEIHFHSYCGTTHETDHIAVPAEDGGVHRGDLSAGQNPVKSLLSSDSWKNSGSTVGAWDVTVVDKNETNPKEKIKSGRTYTKCLAINMGDNAANLTSDLYIVTNDGYIYRTMFNQLDPYGFIFFANNRGLIDKTTDRSAYHSYHTANNSMSDLIEEGTGKLNATFHNPQSKDTVQDKTHMIYFEKPDPELVETLYPKAYVPEEITDFNFVGAKQENVTFVGKGGYFKFRVSKATSATINISFDDYNVKYGTDYKNVSITDNTVSGENLFYWDGKDGTGKAISAGVYDDGINVTVTAHAGEYHFPLFDLERSSGGIEVERVNRIYNRVVQPDGSVIDADVTEQFDSDRYRLYYNNQLKADENDDSPNDSENNQLIKGDESIKNITKYAKYLCTGTINQNDDPDGMISSSSYHTVKVFNAQRTKLENNFTDEQTEQIRQAVYADDSRYADIAYYDYYIDSVIADNRNCLDGVDSSAGGALIYNKPSGLTDGRGYGDMTAIDMWTYATGRPQSVKLNNPIIVVPVNQYNYAAITGKVFFDDDNNAKYELHDGDYNISGAQVSIDYTYTEMRWREFTDENGVEWLLPLQTADDSGKTFDEHDYKLKKNNGGDYELWSYSGASQYLDGDGAPIIVNVTKTTDESGENTYAAEIHKHEIAFTDSDGFYRFGGIPFVNAEAYPNIEVQEGEIKISIARPQDYYSITTESAQSGDFNSFGTEIQSVSFDSLYDKTLDGSAQVRVADVGYYYEEVSQPVILKKIWGTDISADSERPSSVTFHLVGKNPSGEVMFEEDVKLSYNDSSWSKKLEHLPKSVGGAELKYSLAYESFIREGVEYIFDGTSYSGGEAPYNSSFTEDDRLTGLTLAVNNSPLRRIIQITKRADNDRSKLLEGAEFKLMKYDEQSGEWSDVESQGETLTAVTNSAGVALFEITENGKYKVVETQAPLGYITAADSEITVFDGKDLYMLTVYDPSGSVELNVDKEVDISFPNQTLSFKVEVASDSAFTQILKSETVGVQLKAQVNSYSVLENYEIPNCKTDKDIYVRITELNAGSYALESAVVTAADSSGVGYTYKSGEYSYSVDKEAKYVVFRLIASADGVEGYRQYNVILSNTAKIIPESSANAYRFQKIWMNSDLDEAVVVRQGNIYARLMREWTDENGELHAEQVKNAVRGSANGYQYGSVGDSPFTDEGYFRMSTRNWNKNFLGNYWCLPQFSPEGYSYSYYAEEVTNSVGNPLTGKSGGVNTYNASYCVLSRDKYSEVISSRQAVLNIGTYKTTANTSVTLDPEHQSGYFIVNYRLPRQITLQITKSDLNENPLCGAEFTLYSDEQQNKVLQTLITEEDGVGIFGDRLRNGTYYLAETKAPAGYQIDRSTYRLKVNNGIVTLDKKSAESGDWELFAQQSSDEKGVVNLTFTNTFNITIPSSGSGVTAKSSVFTGAAIMLVAAAAAMVYIKKLCKAESKTS